MLGGAYAETQAHPQGRAAKRITKLGEDDICTSIIVAAELRYGCAKSGPKRLLKAVEEPARRDDPGEDE